MLVDPTCTRKLGEREHHTLRLEDKRPLLTAVQYRSSGSALQAILCDALSGAHPKSHVVAIEAGLDKNFPRCFVQVRHVYRSSISCPTLACKIVIIQDCRQSFAYITHDPRTEPGVLHNRQV